MSRSSEISEREQEKLNSGRTLRAESDVLLPLLQTKQSLVIGRIVSDFRAGKTDFIGHAAELSTLFEMKTGIERKIKEAEVIERRIYESDGGTHE